MNSPNQPEDSRSPIGLEKQIPSVHVASADAVEGKKEDVDEESISDDKLPTVFDDTASVHSCNSEITRFSDYQVPMDEDENEDELDLRLYSLSELNDLLW